MLEMFNDPLYGAMTKYLYFFGAFTIVGGIIGYVKAKSRASIIAGSISGVLLISAAWLTGSMGRPGVLLGLFVSAALAARFGNAFRTTKKVFPAGVMTVLAIVGVVLTVLVLVRAR